MIRKRKGDLRKCVSEVIDLKNTLFTCSSKLQLLNVLKKYMLVTQSCPTFATPWTAAHQAPLSIEFSRLKY